MKSLALLLLALLVVFGCAGSASTRPTAVDPATARAEVRRAEEAFAAAFRARDAERFFAFVADDAVFLGAQKTLHGAAEVRATWTRFFAGAPPFSWHPERVEASADGALGLSTGPILDPGGKQIGVYSSVWRRQPDGSWKVAFDGPGCSHASP
jgi:ketosteroid isomerase-like protein